ncbi:thermonuclease family protein [Cyanobacterium sp. Dongsha4]|uniref:thermonuclease family protein n=1 Tax=Cyanobacterium sp. DS4 TaxID=2878255 RepID=UPI002E81F577|nr:thermonuclease family protein [Cyanobacterium sp. Dongsha4]WVL01297.1 thermonuclease family protein [Cyanobacterium sp. Dongsha4]
MIKNLLLICFLIIFLFSCNSSDRVDGINAKINRVISGQTLEIVVDKKIFSLRLMGVEIPSNIDYDKKLAQQHLIRLLTNNYHYPLNSVIVKVETQLNQKDKYGRSIGYVWLNNQLINRKVLEGGWAIASLEYTDGKYDQDLLQGEEYARIMENGVWKIHY